MSPKVQLTLLKAWHAWFAGSFLVAYVTGDDDTYAMHLFAGYAVLTAIAVRLLVGLVVRSGPLRLPRPNVTQSLAWISQRKGRHPLFAWLAAALLSAIGAAAITGALADVIPWLEDPHEAIAEASLWVIFAHIAFVIAAYGGKKPGGRISTWLAKQRKVRAL